MIIKLIGSVIILAAAAAMGMLYSKGKSDRVKQLNSFISALNMLEIEIKFALSLLPDAFSKISKAVDREVGEIFEYTAEKITEHNINACEAWIEGVKKKTLNLAINEEDREALTALGSSLGEVDSESQIKNLRLISERLKGQMVKAEEDRAKNEKLFKNLGVLTGMAVVIILF